jgi:hypothetical protein
VLYTRRSEEGTDGMSLTTWVFIVGGLIALAGVVILLVLVAS